MQAAPALHGAFFRAGERGPRMETEGQHEALIGHRIERPGEPVVGNWVAWRWDGTSLTVTRDRFGAHPLFYAASPTGIAISPSLARVLDTGVSRTLDLDAIAGFAAVGYYLESDTPFRDIRSLPRGATLTWRPGRLELTGGPQPFPSRPIAREAVVEGIIETVRTAVRRCIPAGSGGGYIMPLSGGRDSRHLLLELHRQGHPPRLCVTAGHYPGIGGGEDRRRAARVCAALGIPHRKVAVPRSLVDAELRKNVITSYLTDEHAWSLAIVDALAGRTDHTYDGLPGGTFLQRPWELDGWGELGRAGRFDELASRIVLGRAGRDRYSDLLSHEMLDLVPVERAIGRVRRALAAHRDAPDPALEFRFWNRAMRELALVPTLLLGQVATVHTPYMDPDFVDFSASIPTASVDRDVHDEVIARAFPQVARLPYAKFGRPVMPKQLARSIGRDLVRILMRDSDGTLVDRRRLLGQAVRGSLTGDPRLALGRRPSLIAYLVQLERVVRDGSIPRRADR